MSQTGVTKERSGLQDIFCMKFPPVKLSASPYPFLFESVPQSLQDETHCNPDCCLTLWNAELIWFGFWPFAQILFMRVWIYLNSVSSKLQSQNTPCTWVHTVKLSDKSILENNFKPKHTWQPGHTRYFTLPTSATHHPLWIYKLVSNWQLTQQTPGFTFLCCERNYLSQNRLPYILQAL